MVTKKEIVEKRKSLAQLASKSGTFFKGDKRVRTPRLCVVCGRPLSSLILHENKYIVIQTHTRYYLNDMFKLDVCADINSCYRTLTKKGEMENVDG